MSFKKRITVLTLLIALFSVALLVILYSRTKAPKQAPGGMVLIPGGEFIMGCQGEQTWRCLDEEKPSHAVKIDPFFLDVHEVTVEQYWECIDRGICLNVKDLPSHLSVFINRRAPTLLNHPVNGVNWYDARIYCQWKGGRLPTEAEFEFALRGGLEGATFPWGEELPIPVKAGNYMDLSCLRQFPLKAENEMTLQYDDGQPTTSPVCTYEKNPYGLCDISGNVSEWCLDYYDSRWYFHLPTTKNPVNKKRSEYVVVRGCDWHHEAGRSIRITKRSHYHPDYRHFYIGFRCAKDI